jgi:hypothetical protein
MRRNCTRCTRPFAPADLSRDDSKNLEHDRKAAGLVGVRFLYYRCPGCGTDDIFVDILPRAGETDDTFRDRRDQMEAVVRDLHADRVDAVVVPARRG